jgi:hypothetical protein
MPKLENKHRDNQDNDTQHNDTQHNNISIKQPCVTVIKLFLRTTDEKAKTLECLSLAIFSSPV